MVKLLYDERQLVKASALCLRVAPRKLNLVAGFIRGMNVSVAVKQLRFSKKHVATHVLSCIESAIANAENNFNIDVQNLFVMSAFVGKCKVMRRVLPRARGRSSDIRKFFSNFYVVLAPRLNNS